MPTIRMHETTTASPEQVLAGLTHFGPGREKLFPATADDHLVVHSTGPASADVTEGTAAAWERLRYDWSDPARITMTTVDSNLWGGGSGHTYTLTPRPDGGTDIDVVVVREGRGGKGKLVGLLLGSVGKATLAKALRRTVTAIEAKN